MSRTKTASGVIAEYIPSLYGYNTPRVSRLPKRTYTRRGYGKSSGRGSSYRVGRPYSVSRGIKELHAFDVALGNTTITAPADCSGGEKDPTASSLNAVVQGDDDVNRNGRRIYATSIYINGAISSAAQTGVNTHDVVPVVFIALVLDRQTNGAQLNSEDVFTNPGAAASLASSPFRNLDYSKRFKVLATRMIKMDQPSAAGYSTTQEQAGQYKNFKIWVNLHNMPMTYKSNVGDVTDCIDNSLHMIVFTQDTSLVPKIQYNSRLRFWNG